MQPLVLAVDMAGLPQAWVELEYNRKVHSETGETPLQRYLSGKSVGRPCPSSETLRLAFCAEPPDRIAEGVSRLAAALERMRAGAAA